MPNDADSRPSAPPEVRLATSVGGRRLTPAVREDKFHGRTVALSQPKWRCELPRRAARRLPALLTADFHPIRPCGGRLRLSKWFRSASEAAEAR